MTDANQPIEARRAVHEDAVDHAHVAALPEARADRARAAGEEERVELVEAVLAIEDPVDDAEALRAITAGQVRPHEVEIGRPWRCRRARARTAAS